MWTAFSGNQLAVWDVTDLEHLLGLVPVDVTDLEHLLDLPAGQVDVELVQQLVDLLDVQQAVSVLVGFLERLLHPRLKRTPVKENIL